MFPPSSTSPTARGHSSRRFSSFCRLRSFSHALTSKRTDPRMAKTVARPAKKPAQPAPYLVHRPSCVYAREMPRRASAARLLPVGGVQAEILKLLQRGIARRRALVPRLERLDDLVERRPHVRHDVFAVAAQEAASPARIRVRRELPSPCGEARVNGHSKFPHLRSSKVRGQRWVGTALVLALGYYNGCVQAPLWDRSNSSSETKWSSQRPIQIDPLPIQAILAPAFTSRSRRIDR